MGLADAEPRRVVRADPLHRRERVFAGELDLTHVADVEQACRRSHGHMFGHDAGVLDGHVPAAERHHPGPERAVRGIQWSFFELGRGRLIHWDV